MKCPNCQSPHVLSTNSGDRTCQSCLTQWTMAVTTQVATELAPAIINTPIANFPIPATPPLAPTPMSPNHPRWKEFCTLMRGPSGCNISPGADGKFNGICNGAAVRPITRKVLGQFPDVDIEESLMRLGNQGGFCDCRVAIGVCK